MAGKQRISDIQQQLHHWWIAGVTDIPLELAANILAACRESLNSANELEIQNLPDANRHSLDSSIGNNSEGRTSDSSTHGNVDFVAAPGRTTANPPIRTESLPPGGLPIAILPSNLSGVETSVPSAPVETTAKELLPANADGSLLIDIDHPYPPKLESPERSERLAALQATVAGCTRCPELCRRRTQTVFGVGNVMPRICFLGEAPGFEEDRQGQPFVGPAGQLLDRILEASKLQRDQVYILNVAKCRPPGNRQPTDEEINQCWGYATQQLEILQPEYIVCLGATAARGLLRVKYSIPTLREKFHRYRDSKVLVTYHPSYLLRTPDAKRFVWADMKLLMRQLGVEL